jgi:hypothetical protein
MLNSLMDFKDLEAWIDTLKKDDTIVGAFAKAVTVDILPAPRCKTGHMEGRSTLLIALACILRKTNN